jgi:predicted outer membrane protein
MKNSIILALALVAPALASAADTLSDAQIAAIVVTANQIDINAG